MQHIANIWHRSPTELLLWLTGLTALYFINPHVHGYSLCPLSMAGWQHYCPGCGIGRAINLCMHGHWALSYKMHPLGMPALLIILHRIYQLIKVYV